MWTVELKGITGGNKIWEAGKKINLKTVFCILVSTVCYFEFMLKRKKLITDSEDRCRLRGTRQFAIGIILSFFLFFFFFFHSSSLASRDSRSKMLINLNFLLKYQNKCFAPEHYFGKNQKIWSFI